MLWIHGGGFILGTPEQDEANIVRMCRELGIIVGAVNYRLGPDYPFPAALHDCYAALAWLHGAAGELGIATGRIAIGGNSAGAGLAASLAQYAHDEGTIRVAFQLLIYPMLDDRTTNRTDIDQTRLRLWNSKSNIVGWTTYLGKVPGGADLPDYAAPARRKNLEGLPPAWIGVGTCDLFHDEDVAYATRLQEAGVPCTLKVVAGAFHGFDLAGEANVVQDFRQSYMEAMRSILAT
jgi:acetyl esterase/lipase